MVVDAVDAVVVRLAVALPGEDVDFVPAPLQGGGQLGDVDADAADGDGMKGFPRKQRNAHRTILRNTRGGNDVVPRAPALRGGRLPRRRYREATLRLFSQRF